MSQENVEIARRWYEVATSKADLLAAMPRTMAFCHPDVEWSAPEDGTTYRGREGVRQRLEEWLNSFDDYRYEIDRIIDCGDDEVLVEASEVGRGASSGAEVRATNYDPRRDDRSHPRVLRRGQGPRSRRAFGVGRASALREKQKRYGWPSSLVKGTGCLGLRLPPLTVAWSA